MNNLHRGTTTAEIEIPTAFTVGRTSSYEQAFEENPAPKKLGRYDDEEGKTYGGGWVWASKEAAQAFLRTQGTLYGAPSEEFSVYGLVLPHGWATDVSENLHPDDGVHRLLVDAPLVRLT